MHFARQQRSSGSQILQAFSQAQFWWFIQGEQSDLKQRIRKWPKQRCEHATSNSDLATGPVSPQHAQHVLSACRPAAVAHLQITALAVRITLRARLQSAAPGLWVLNVPIAAALRLVQQPHLYLVCRGGSGVMYSENYI